MHIQHFEDIVFDGEWMLRDFETFITRLNDRNNIALQLKIDGSLSIVIERNDEGHYGISTKSRYTKKDREVYFNNDEIDESTCGQIVKDTLKKVLASIIQHDTKIYRIFEDGPVMADVLFTDPVGREIFAPNTVGYRLKYPGFDTGLVIHTRLIDGKMTPYRGTGYFEGSLFLPGNEILCSDNSNMELPSSFVFLDELNEHVQQWNSVLKDWVKRIPNRMIKRGITQYTPISHTSRFKYLIDDLRNGDLDDNKISNKLSQSILTELPIIHKLLCLHSDLKQLTLEFLDDIERTANIPFTDVVETYDKETGKKILGEGVVVTYDDRVIKFVDRSTFSYNNFKRFNELETRVCVTFGRFNPPTIGHMRHFLTIVEEAEEHYRFTGEPTRMVVGVSATTGDNSNPLSPEDRIGHIEHVLKHCRTPATQIEIVVEKDLFSMLKNNIGVKNRVEVHMGGDYFEDWEKQQALMTRLQKYTNNSTIQLINSGDRDERISGTLARQYAVSREFDKFWDVMTGDDNELNMTEQDIATIYETIGNRKDINETNI